MDIDPNSLRYFVDLWMHKSNYTNNEDDYSFIDRFVYTYISFNALYTAATYIEVGQSHTVGAWPYSLGGLPNKSFRSMKHPLYSSEKARATKLVVDIIGKNSISDFLNPHQASILSLCECFDKGEMYLHEDKNGNPDHKKDLLLISRARNSNPEALLTIIYLLRCNLFHGAKALSSRQDTPLSSATVLLKAFINPFLESLENKISMLN